MSETVKTAKQVAKSNKAANTVETVENGTVANTTTNTATEAAAATATVASKTLADMRERVAALKQKIADTVDGAINGISAALASGNNSYTLDLTGFGDEARKAVISQLKGQGFVVMKQYKSESAYVVKADLA